MTDKMKLFCLEYMKDFNATQAAIRAGYKKKTAYSIGNENLKKPEIKKTLDKLKTELVNGKDKIILDNIIFWKSVRDDPKSKTNDKLKASEYLGKYAAMFTEKIDLTGNLQHEILEPVSLDDLESQILEEVTRDEE